MVQFRFFIYRHHIPLGIPHVVGGFVLTIYFFNPIPGGIVVKIEAALFLCIHYRGHFAIHIPGDVLYFLCIVFYQIADGVVGVIVGGLVVYIRIEVCGIYGIIYVGEFIKWIISPPLSIFTLLREFLFLSY